MIGIIFSIIFAIVLFFLSIRFLKEGIKGISNKRLRAEIGGHGKGTVIILSKGRNAVRIGSTWIVVGLFMISMSFYILIRLFLLFFEQIL